MKQRILLVAYSLTVVAAAARVAIYQPNVLPREAQTLLSDEEIKIHRRTAGVEHNRVDTPWRRSKGQPAEQKPRHDAVVSNKPQISQKRQKTDYKSGPSSHASPSSPMSISSPDLISHELLSPEKTSRSRSPSVTSSLQDYKLAAYHNRGAAPPRQLRSSAGARTRQSASPFHPQTPRIEESAVVGIPPNLPRVKIKGDTTNKAYKKLVEANWNGESQGPMLREDSPYSP